MSLHICQSHAACTARSDPERKLGASRDDDVHDGLIGCNKCPAPGAGEGLEILIKEEVMRMLGVVNGESLYSPPNFAVKSQSVAQPLLLQVSKSSLAQRRALHPSASAHYVHLPDGEGALRARDAPGVILASSGEEGGAR